MVLWLMVTRSGPSLGFSGEKLVQTYLYPTARLGPVTSLQWYVCCRAREHQNMSSFPLPISCFCLLRVLWPGPGEGAGRETSAGTQERQASLLGRTPGRRTLPRTASVSRSASDGTATRSEWVATGVSEEQEGEQLTGGLWVPRLFCYRTQLLLRPLEMLPL